MASMSGGGFHIALKLRQHVLFAQLPNSVRQNNRNEVHAIFEVEQGVVLLEGGSRYSNRLGEAHALRNPMRSPPITLGIVLGVSLTMVVMFSGVVENIRKSAQASSVPLLSAVVSAH